MQIFLFYYTPNGQGRRRQLKNYDDTLSEAITAIQNTKRTGKNPADIGEGVP